MLALLILLFGAILGEGRKNQETATASCINGEGTCHQDFSFVSLEDPSLFLGKIKGATDSAMKEALLSVMKATVGQIDLPKPIKDKLNDEEFIKGNIDLVMKENEDKIMAKSSEDASESSTQTATKSSVTSSTKWSPYGGEVRVKNWHDFYRNFPYMANNVLLWKLEFKETALKNAEKFGGCANPAKLVDWLVPDIEEVKKDQQRKK